MLLSKQFLTEGRTSIGGVPNHDDVEAYKNAGWKQLVMTRCNKRARNA